MRFKNWMAALHYRPGPGLSPWLWPLMPLEWGYRLGVACRLLAYEQGWFPAFEPGIPVISVGNLTTGGTGKTPVVIEIARGLVQAGKTVLILSRGYGAADPVEYARALDPRHGDEAYLIQEQVPEAVVVVGPDRVKTLQRALRDYRPDCVVLDDGFQYLPLKRRINILLIDGERLLGNGHLLPVGPLREPMDQIKRADLVFITKQVAAEAIEQVEAWIRDYGKSTDSVPVVPVVFQPGGLKAITQQCAADEAVDVTEPFQNRECIAVSGVADPDRFERNLHEQGLKVLHHYRYGDHHVYTELDVATLLAARIQHAAGGEPPILVTTEKDLPKLRSLLPQEVQSAVYTLQMRPALDGHWFYHEFLSPMPAAGRVEEAHVRPESGF